MPPTDFAIVPPASPERRAADAGIECIGCGICQSACDVVDWKIRITSARRRSTAPGRLVNDVRDAAHEARINAVSGSAGCHACHTHMNCTEFCPRGISPTYSIAGLKRAMIVAPVCCFSCAVPLPRSRSDGPASGPRRILFIAQRASAAVLAFAVTVHLATILYAVRGGLTAGEVLARTRDNHWFFAFYVLFVLAVAVHAPIGLRNVLREWTRWHGRSLDVALALFSALLLVARHPRRARGLRLAREAARMMRASHTQPGFLAALVHRLAGIALAIFLPLHFWALVQRAQRRRLSRQVPEDHRHAARQIRRGRHRRRAVAAHGARPARACHRIPAGARAHRVSSSRSALPRRFAVGLAFLLNVV